MCARVCQSVLECARVCQSVPELCQSVPERARACQSVPECARVVTRDRHLNDSCASLLTAWGLGSLRGSPSITDISMSSSMSLFQGCKGGGVEGWCEGERGHLVSIFTIRTKYTMHTI